MLWRTLIIIGGFVLFVLGTCLLHWLFNIQGWINAYIKDRRQRSKASPRVAQRDISASPGNKPRRLLRTKVIEFLDRKHPQQAKIYIYCIAGGGLLLIIGSLFILVYVWHLLE